MRYLLLKLHRFAKILYIPPMQNQPSTLENEKLPRQLGVWGIWLLVVNGLIGAGIFGLPSGASALAGDYSVWIYVICATLMLPVILSFAEAGSYFRALADRFVTEQKLLVHLSDFRPVGCITWRDLFPFLPILCF